MYVEAILPDNCWYASLGHPRRPARRAHARHVERDGARDQGSAGRVWPDRHRVGGRRRAAGRPRRPPPRGELPGPPCRRRAPHVLHPRVEAWGGARRRQGVGEAPRRVVLAGLAAGALAVLAYGLVLWAQTRGELAPIAALRETSVIFGALIAAIAFKEPFGRPRILAATLVAAGLVVLNLG